MVKNVPLKIAYSVANILRERGYEAGVVFSAKDASVAIKIGVQLLETKICQELADMGDKWLADKFEEYIKKVN